MSAASATSCAVFAFKSSASFAAHYLSFQKFDKYEAPDKVCANAPWSLQRLDVPAFRRAI
jgi:hypothetical protein